MSADFIHAVEMRGISKEFPGVRALNDVTLRIKRGSIHALLGENGAGKSTLMKILDGVYPSGSFSGEIVLEGVAVEFHSPQDARRKGVGYVPQEIAVLEELTIAENIFIGHWTAGSSWLVDFEGLFARADKFLNECRIALDPRVRVASLGASQRQLVMIARALSTRPKVLILDEATASLTQSETQNLFRLLRHLREGGVSILFISHRLAEIVEVADRTTVLRDGAVVGEFERGSFTENDLVVAMIGRKLENFYPTRTSVIGTEEVLRVENLTIPHSKFVRRNFVENVSFTVRRGEILGIGGLLGSGRSEIVNALYGRLEHTGRIWVAGREVRIRTPKDARRYGIGLLTEDRKAEGLLFNFGVRENITLHDLKAVSRMNVVARDREDAAAGRYKDQLDIRAPSIDSRMGTLSGGNQQKVVLAKVLFPRPQILLLDEPTKGVDVGAKNEIYRLMMEWASAGISIVVISSELPELIALCDRFIVLAQNRVVDAFTKAEASEARVMVAATR